MAHPNPIIDAHLIKTCGVGGYTVSGAVATVTAASLTPYDVHQLVEGCAQQKFDTIATAGVLKIQPRA